MFKNRIPYNVKMLSEIVRHNVDIVEKAVKIFRELELVEILENGAIYIIDIQNFIGESSTEADRKRNYRKRIETEQNKALTQSKDKCPDKCLTEIEIETELEIEIKKDIYSDKSLVRNEAMFNELWKLYPNKKGKTNAYKKYLKTKVDDETIKQGILNYIGYIKLKKIQPQFIKHGSTWFNEEAWNDDYSEVVENIEDKKARFEEMMKYR